MDRLGTDLPIIEQSKVYREVLVGPERRRRWTSEEKARIVAESLVSNAVSSTVARRNGIHPNQLCTWRRELLRVAGGGKTTALPDFVPVSLTADPRTPGLPVEITVNDMTVRVAPGVDLAFLSTVLHVVRSQG
jgi:transposase